MEKIFNLLLKNYKKTALVLGLLSGLAFPPTYAFILFIFAFCVALKLVDKLSSYKKVVVFSYFLGFSYFVAGFYWIGNALLVDIGSFGWIYPIALLSIGAFFGIFMILPFVVWRYIQQNNVWLRVILFAYVWVLLEWIRSFIFTGFAWNMLGTIFSFNEIFIQTASVCGTYGLSFLALVITGSFYAFFIQKKKSGIVVFLLIVSFIIGFGVWRLNKYPNVDSDIKVRLVQPSIAQNMKWKREELERNFLNYVNLSKQESLQTVDFVVWGETALPFDINYYTEYNEIIKEAIPYNGYLITGVVRHDISNGAYRVYNSMYVLNNRADVVDFYDKNHLVPFGEYIPFRKYLPGWIKPVANNIAEFSIGEKFKNIKLAEYPRFGGLICYEAIFPDDVVNRKNKPDWLVVLANDGWYGNSSGPYQHLVASQMRAVEEGISIVRSANSGISAVIDSLGRIKAQIPLHYKGYVDAYLPKNEIPKTIYSKIGKFGVFTIILLILLVFYIQRKVVTRVKYKISVDTNSI